MTTNVYSGQFGTFWCGNAAAPSTVVEYSSYLDKLVSVKLTYDDRDATTFATGGVAIAERHERGAVSCSVACTFNLCPTVTNLVRQLIGQRSGFTVKCTQGSNAAPNVGDEVFLGTMTLTEFTLNGLQPGQKLTLTANFAPAETGAITPQIKTL